MKSTELRIGNLILDTNHPERKCYVGRLCIKGGEYPITYFYDKAYEDTPKNGEGLQGIPLTDELFLKMGGKEMSGWIGLKFEVKVWDEEAEYTFELMDGKLTLYCNDVRLKKFDNPFVHNLQNLYFAITEDELVLAVTPINTKTNDC